jgi:hypothetical protein
MTSFRTISVNINLIQHSPFELWAVNPETYKDALVGLQVVTRTREDEALRRMGELVDQAMKVALSGHTT